METTDDMNIGELLDEIRGQNKVVLKIGLNTKIELSLAL